MNLPQFSVNRRITVLMIFFTLFIFGAVSFFQLPVDLMPQIEPPSVSVITFYPGAGAEDVETKVTEVIEDAISVVSNLEHLNSISQDNLSVVTALFSWGTDLNEASNDIRDRLDFVKRRLPDDIEQPRIFKFNTSMFPVMVAGVTAVESYDGLHYLIKEKMADPLKRVPGVGAVAVFGGKERQIQVRIDPNRLAAYEISYNEIIDVLAAENLNLPSGTIKMGHTEYLVRVPGEFEDVSQIKMVVVSQYEGKLVHLQDVAEVADDFKELTVVSRSNGRPGVILLIQKQSGANTVEVVDEVRKRLKEVKQTLPPDVDIVELMDGSIFIRQAIGNLGEAVLFGGLFVILVVFLFLRRLRSSLIVILTIPFSLISAFLFLYIFKYSLNMISLMSLAIALGMVVDDAIVILENITRHVEEGESPSEAAVFGSSEVGLAVMASTLTTVSVFAPMIFATGLVGIMFKQLALVVIVTIMASLFAALTLTPALSAWLLRKENPQKVTKSRWGAKFYVASERTFRGIENLYRRLLSWVLGHKKVTILITLGIFISSLLLIPLIKTEFIPEEDTGDLQVTLELSPGTRIEHSEEVAKRMEKIFREKIPELELMFSRAGQTEMGFSVVMGLKEGPHIVLAGGKLVEQKKRHRSTAEIAASIRPDLGRIPGVAKIDIEAGNPITSFLFFGAKPISIEIIGHDMEVANHLAKRIKEIVKNTPGATDVRIERGEDRPELHVVIDREKASKLGLNTGMIAMALRTQVYGREATKFREGGEEYEIFLRTEADKRRNIEDIENLIIPTMAGGMVRLKEVAAIEEGTSPTTINRRDQERIIKVEAGIYKRALGEVTKDIERQLRKLDIPADITVKFGGEVEEQRKSLNTLILLLILGVVLVYMVMASQFESLLDPFVIMFSVPFAFVGVIWAFLITQTTINLISFLGMIILIGVVVKNAIVLVDYTNILRSRDLELNEALVVAGGHRLRPVLMTAFTTMLAMLPMALSRYEGSEIWRPFGITVIGGLLVSTLVTLILVPTVYAIFEKGREKFGEYKR